MKEKEWKTVNLWVAVPVIMQIAIAAQMLWGHFGKAWSWSWLSSYAGVVLCLELLFYNESVKKTGAPFKALYPIIIMLGCAFFFTGGFAFRGWNWSWIGLALAAVGLAVAFLVNKSQAKKG